MEWSILKCKQSRPGFELGSPFPYPTTITIKPQVVSPYIFICMSMCVYVFVCICVCLCVCEREGEREREKERIESERKQVYICKYVSFKTTMYSFSAIKTANNGYFLSTLLFQRFYRNRYPLVLKIM